MKPKHQRLALLGIAVLALGGAAALILTAFSDNLVFFWTPSELATKSIAPNTRVRIGGLVEQGSVVKNGENVTFKVTDMAHSVPVAYHGILPDLFREGQGVVAEGKFQNGTFQASEVLAKHDEKYMPPEVVDALKKSGEWQKGQ